MTQEKKTVQYDVSRGTVGIAVGCSATVWPIDHTSPRVSNNYVCYTSTILRVEPDGEFETMNSIYKPAKETN